MRGRVLSISHLIGQPTSYLFFELIPLSCHFFQMITSFSHVKGHCSLLRQYQPILPLAHPAAKLLSQPTKSFTRSVVDLRSCDIIFGDFSHTLLVLHPIVRMQMDLYIGIPKTRVSILKLGHVFALFRRLTQ